MEPKTNYQKKLNELRLKLKPVTEKKIQWGYDKCLDPFYLISRKTVYCLECGHTWRMEGEEWQEKVITTECPSCKKRLKETGGRDIKDLAYFGILTTIENFQVIRIFTLTKYMKKKEPCTVHHQEVMQHWIEDNGKITSFSKTVQGMSRYYDQWNYMSEMSIQHTHFQKSGRFTIIPFKIHPEKKVLPILKRNGFSGNYYNSNPQELFSLILRNQKAETLIKAGQISLLKKIDGWSNAVEERWVSIKICLRNNYIVKDATEWFDYLKLLEHFGKDLLNAKYICPSDLKKEHDKYVEKRREQQRKKELIKTLLRMEEDQLLYAEQKKNFMNLEFQKENLRIVVLKSVYDFKECSDILRHCIFTNRYHEKEKSLLFKAEVDGKIIETVEVSLTKMKVIQARGSGNKESEFNKEIISLVNSNMKQIAKIHNQKNKPKKGIKLIPAVA